jgi:hypothetical protein
MLMWGKPDQMRAWSPECELAWHRIYFRAQSGSSAVVPCAHTRPLPHIPGAAFAFALGGDPWSYLALSRASRAPHLLSHWSGSWWWSIPTLALTHTLPALCLLSRSVGMLGGDTLCPLAFSHTLLALHLLSRLVRKLGGGAVYPSSPPLAHSNTLPMQKGWTGEKKPTSEGHLPLLEHRARTGQDNKRKKASNEHSRIVEHRVRNWSRQ